MDNTKLAEIAQGATKTLVKHSPKILTAMGIAGMFTTVLFAIGAKGKADLLIDEAKALKAEEEGKDVDKRNEEVTLTKWETVKAVTPAYWPTAAMFVLSAAAIVGSDYISDKRQVALSAAYTIADLGLKEYQKKTEETIGAKKAQEIEQKIVQDRVNRKPIDVSNGVSSRLVQHVQDESLPLFYEPILGHYFMAKIEEVDSIINQMNRLLNMERDVTIDDLYYEISKIAVTEHDLNCGIEGSRLGWTFEDGLLERVPLAVIEPNTGRSAIVLKLNHSPHDLDRNWNT
jgi:hypothetical protein